MIQVFWNSKYKSFERKFDEVIDFIAAKTNCSSQMRPKLVSELRYFKAQFKSKWERYNRHKERFLCNEGSWLDENHKFNVFSPRKGGRPYISFDESSENTKRRKTSNLRSEFDADLLAYAAQMKMRSSGRSTEANVIKKVAETPQYAKDCFNLSNSAKT